MQKIKISVGIILFRINSETNNLEVLLAQKRFTYAFSEFVHGVYNRNICQSSDSVLQMLNLMTREELLDIWSLNFHQMWYRVWPAVYDPEQFDRKMSKFKSTFISTDKGKFLKECILRSESSGRLVWEAPKGRHLSPLESDLSCAIREMYEETNISKDKYTMIHGIKRRACLVHENTKYMSTYYIAIADKHLKNTKTFSNGIESVSEMRDTKWFTLESLKLVDDQSERLYKLLKPAFKLVKKYMKGNLVSKKMIPLAPPSAAVVTDDSAGWKIASRKKKKLTYP